MRTSKEEMTPSADSERLVAWRVERLRGAGCSVRLAQSLARDPRYDLHEVLELIDRGCPAELAARILAPLDADVADAGVTRDRGAAPS
jgi:hypothetical protein